MAKYDDIYEREKQKIFDMINANFPFNIVCFKLEDIRTYDPDTKILQPKQPFLAIEKLKNAGYLYNPIGNDCLLIMIQNPIQNSEEKKVSNKDEEKLDAEKKTNLKVVK